MEERRRQLLEEADGYWATRMAAEAAAAEQQRQMLAEAAAAEAEVSVPCPAQDINGRPVNSELGFCPASPFLIEDSCMRQ